MKKQVATAFGKKIYLLGVDSSGIKYWLEESTWDCGWYWSAGYVETYSNNTCPSRSRDLRSHQHFDSLFLRNPNEHAHTAFRKFFTEYTVSNEELWKLCDLMQTIYTLKHTAELFGRGYSYYTEKAKLDDLVRIEEVDLINKKLLPELFAEVYKLLSDEEVVK